MSHRLLRHLNSERFVRSRLPLVCESCFGDDPNFPLTRETDTKECKICSQRFTLIRWRPQPESSLKETEICQFCVKLKNMCQACLVDLMDGLPVQDVLVPVACREPDGEHDPDPEAKLVPVVDGLGRQTKTPSSSVAWSWCIL